MTEKRMLFEDKLRDLANLLSAIELTSGRNDKMILLSGYSDSEFLKKVLLYTYNPYFVYGVNKRTFATNSYSESPYDDLFSLLDILKQNIGTTEQTKESVRMFVDSFEDELSELIKKIILKDLKIGVNIETINKVFPKLIPVFKTALCETYETEKDLRGSRYMIQPKLDGVRCMAIVKDGGVELYSRNGSRISGYDDIEDALNAGEWNGYVLDGEIMGEDFDNTMEGLFALGKQKKAKYYIFDIMTIAQFNERKVPSPYNERYIRYSSIIRQYEGSPLVPVKGIFVSRSEYIADSEELMNTYVKQGYEGIIVKDLQAPYEFKRSYNWLKDKPWLYEDFRVIAFKEGEGKYAGTLGAITIVTKDDVMVDVGSGFSDAQRDEIWNNQSKYNWVLAEIKFQGYTKDGSLRFPTFKIFRDDK